MVRKAYAASRSDIRAQTADTIPVSLRKIFNFSTSIVLHVQHPTWLFADK